MRLHVPSFCGVPVVMTVLIMLFTATMTVTAAPDITNINAKTEKRKDPNAGRDEVWVVLDYDIKDLPDEGGMLKLEAKLTDSKGNSFTLEPLAGEMTGAIGKITGDGRKQITWNAEKTLVRARKQGKYTCVITLSLTGVKGASGATLVVTAYAPSGWNYFDAGPAIIKDLKQTDGFKMTDTCTARGDNWHSTVEAGAVFYTGDVTRTPRFRGRRDNDNMHGSDDASGCSAFLAIKDQGTPDEKIWVSFARHYSGRIPNPSGGAEIVVDWEFQFRYFGKKKDGSKNLKAGNGGSPTNPAWTEFNQGADFALTLDATPLEEEKSNSFDLEVVRREFKYYYNKQHVMTFTANGDSYFEGSDANPERLELKKENGDPDMNVNGWLHFSGSFSIDTTTDNATLYSTGEWMNTGGDLLWNGLSSGKVTDGMADLASRGDTILNVKKQIGGLNVFATSLKFIGGAENATGIRMDIFLPFDQLHSGCGYDRKGSSWHEFKGVTLNDDGWGMQGLELQNLSLKAAPTFCLKSLKALSYDNAANTLLAEMVVSCPMFEDVAGAFIIKQGKVENASVTVTPGGTPIPLPSSPPPAHSVEWKELHLSLSNLSSGPVTFNGPATFTNNSNWQSVGSYVGIKSVISQIPNVDLGSVSLFEISGECNMVYDGDLTGDLTAKLFKLSGGFWLAQGSLATTFHFTSPAGIQLDGIMKYYNFGGSQWFLEGTGTRSISLYNGFKFSGVEQGKIYIPDIVTTDTGSGFWDWCDRKFGLPYTMPSTEVTVNDLQMHLDGRLPILGSVRFVVDLSKDPETDLLGFMHPTTTLTLSAVYSKKGPSTLSADDTTWAEFTATAETEKVFADVWNTATAPGSVLADPAGKLYTGTTTDSSVILYPQTRPGEGTLWALRNPAPGRWRLGIIDMKPGDSTYIFAITATAPALQLTSESNGREVLAHWNGAGAADGSVIDLFLDSDRNGFNGTYIGSAAESAGEFRFMLNDTLPECGYYLYAMRVGRGGDGSVSYSQTHHPNPKTSLLPPTNIRAEGWPNGDATITWDKSPDPTVLEYVIHVADENGRDSIYAIVDFNFSMATIHVDNWQKKTVSILARDDIGLQGCPSAQVNFALAEVDDQLTGGHISNGLQVAVAPHPLTGRSTLFVNLAKASPLVVDLYDNAGRKIAVLEQGYFEPGTVRVELDAASLPDGMYIVRISGNDISASRKIIVRH